MNDHIPKPFDPDALVDVLAKWIKRDGKPRARSDEPPKRIRKYKAKRFPGSAKIPESLPGIDVDTGLKRARGNTALYHKLLLLLEEKYGDVVEQVESSQEQDDIEEARATVHSLKGTSGMLGADNLFEASSALERSLKDGEVDQELIERFRSAVDVVLDGIRPLREQTGKKATPEGPVSDTAELTVALATLREPLSMSSPIESREKAKKLGKLVWPKSMRADVDALLERLAGYDFVGAVDVLDQLEKDLNGMES